MKKKNKKIRFFNIKSSLFLFGALGLLIVLISIFFYIKFTQNSSQECANSESCIKDLSGKYDESAKVGVFMGKNINIPPDKKDIAISSVLGDNTISNKHFYVDLTNQKLYAKEGNKTIYEFLISSGKWGKTPTGDFNIWIKVNSTRMKGGSRELGTYYDLPNVQWTMFFYNDKISKSRGYGIHGAYWHNNFGHPMSHGCINMRTEEAKLIYDWADPISTGYSTLVTSQNPGTPITIYGKAANY